MSLPRIYDQPENLEAWQSWAWNHQANHFDIVAAGTRLQQTSLTLATTIGSLVGGFVVEFADTAGIKPGMVVSDVTTPSAITTGSQVVAFNATEVQIGLPLPNNVTLGDNILFSPGANVLALTQFQLSPIDPKNPGMFLYQHQIMHNQANAILGTSGFDLLTLDWSDPDQLAQWLQQNGDEHVKFCTALGIG